MTNAVSTVEQVNTSDGYIVLIYRNEQGEVVAEVKTLILELEEVKIPTPMATIEEEILIETRYQTTLLEMTTLGGI